MLSRGSETENYLSLAEPAGISPFGIGMEPGVTLTAPRACYPVDLLFPKGRHLLGL